MEENEGLLEKLRTISLHMDNEDARSRKGGNTIQPLLHLSSRV